MTTVLFRIAAIVAIAGGFALKMNGYPEGDSILKIGIAIITVSVLIGMVRIPHNSRGTM